MSDWNALFTRGELNPALPVAPPRLVIVPGNSGSTRVYDSYGPTYSYLSDDGYYSTDNCYRPSYSAGYTWSYRPTHYRTSRHYAPTYYYGGHSWSHGSHRYSRTLDNVQYYLRWPFGHRHR